jgi:hypothetical protein
MAEALTGVSATGARGTVTPTVRIALTGVSATGALGLLTKDVLPGESFTLLTPAMVIELAGASGTTGELNLRWPQVALAMTGTTPETGTVTLRTPQFGLALQGAAGTTGELALRAPTLGLSFGDGDGLTLELPLPTLQLAGSSGGIGELALRYALPGLQLAGDSDVVGTLVLRRRLPTLVLDTSSGTIGTISRTLPLPTLRMSGAAGTLGTLAITQPLPELVISGNYAATGVLAITAPAISLVMQGITQGTTAQVAATRVTYALQTERQALTRYTNFPFNSFAVFGGRYLGASDDGIFELTGDTDAGVAIDAAARFGITDMNTSRVKRVEYVYIGARTAKGEKALLLRVTTNETRQRDYGVKASISDGLHTTRVELGMGVESRYWQFELRNRGGADFSVDTVDVLPTPQRRRLGAKDA